MSDPDAIPPNVVQLTNDMLNGRIDSDGVKQLEEELRGNTAGQKFLRGYCQLHLHLCAETQAHRVIQAFASGDWADGDGEKTVVSVDADPKLATHGGHRTTRSRAYGYVLALAASLAFLAFLNTLRTKHVVLDAAPIASITAAVTTKADVVSVSLTSNESRWLPIKDVGKIYVQGPAELELIGTTRAKLKKGKVRVHITDPRGHGFVVETPREEVTDLGTEFGVAVAGDSDTNVVVFEGSVDLAYPNIKSEGAPHKERLVQGEGLAIDPTGAAQRIMSIVRKDMATFRTQSEHAVDNGQLITDVSDNIRSDDIRSFYEIVPQGLKEDVLAYVDRPSHEWNGVGKKGMPAYLVGADYVKPFNSDKTRDDVEITVTLARPARLFVFFDSRVRPPQWLQQEFRDTGDQIGHDAGVYVLKGFKNDTHKRGKGAGVSVDTRFSIWEQRITQPGAIRLGPNSGETASTAMYGIAAIPLEVGTIEKTKKALETSN